MNARQSWFDRFEGRWIVLWWVPERHFPEVADGLARFQHLRRHGNTPYAFTVGTPYPSPVGGQDYPPVSSDAAPAERKHAGSFRAAVVKSKLPWFLDC